MTFGCRCGGTGYAVKDVNPPEQTEILRNATTGRVLLPWEIRAIPIERMRQLVAAGEIAVEPKTIQYQVADLRGFCRECKAGREREHTALANTPVLHKRTRTRKNGEDERDAS